MNISARGQKQGGARKGTLLCLAAFAGMSLLCGAAFVTPSWAQSDVGSRINRLENEIETLSRAVFKGETPPPGAFSSGNAAQQGATETRLSDLEMQLRELTNRVEQQDFEIRNLKAQLQNPAVTAPAAEMRQMGAQGGSLYGQYGEDLAAQNAVPPSALTSALGGGTPSYEASAGSPVRSLDVSPRTPEETAMPNSLGTLPGAAPDEAARMYESAFAYVRDRRYDDGEKALMEFLRAYPGHALAPNAKYWLGETYYVRGIFDQSARVFAEAYQEAPKGAKAPDNLLKLALSLSGMGKKQDACVALAQFGKDFGSTPSPVLDRANREKATLNCR